MTLLTDEWGAEPGRDAADGLRWRHLTASAVLPATGRSNHDGGTFVPGVWRWGRFGWTAGESARDCQLGWARTMMRISVMSSMAYRSPSRPIPESLTPP